MCLLHVIKDAIYNLAGIMAVGAGPDYQVVIGGQVLD